MPRLERMTVTIDLTREEIVTLGNWASVSRTFDQVEKLLENCECKQGADEQDCLYCGKEVKQLHAPLSSIASKIRDQIWKVRDPLVDQVIQQYQRKEIDFDQAVKGLVDASAWEFKAKEWLRELPPERKDFS